MGLNRGAVCFRSRKRADSVASKKPANAARGCRVKENEHPFTANTRNPSTAKPITVPPANSSTGATRPALVSLTRTGAGRCLGREPRTRVFAADRQAMAGRRRMLFSAGGQPGPGRKSRRRGAPSLTDRPMKQPNAWCMLQRHGHHGRRLA
jgi:hypothetical protein